MAYKKRTTHKTRKAKIELVASRMIDAGWREIQTITGMSYYAARNLRGAHITAYRTLLVQTVVRVGLGGNTVVRQSGMSSRTVWKYIASDDWKTLTLENRCRIVSAMQGQDEPLTPEVAELIDSEPQNQQTNATNESAKEDT